MIAGRIEDSYLMPTLLRRRHSSSLNLKESTTSTSTSTTTNFNLHCNSTCPAEVKEARAGPRRFQDQGGLDFNSQLDVFTRTSRRVDMAEGSVLELLSTSPPSWSTLLPRSWSWLATPPGTIRRSGSTPGTSPWPSGTTTS